MKAANNQSQACSNISGVVPCAPTLEDFSSPSVPSAPSLQDFFSPSEILQDMEERMARERNELQRQRQERLV